MTAPQFVCVYLCVYVCVSMFLCVCGGVGRCMRARVFLEIFFYVCVYATCVCVCMCVCVCTEDSRELGFRVEALSPKTDETEQPACA